MTKDELLQSLTDIGTITDDAERRSKIVSISEEIKTVYETNETLTASNTKLGEDNQKLKNYNMELYLQVGGSQKQNTKTTEPKSEELKYENLFNEKGELK